MDSLDDALKRMGKAIRPENTPISSNPESSDSGICRICSQETICDGLGVVRYEVPVDDPRFGKLFRCPYNAVALDTDRQERLRRISHLDAYKEKTFYSFTLDLPTLKPSEQMSLQLALTSSAQFAESPTGWLLLEGTYGCGKTHLAAAIGNELLQRGEMVLFITVPDLLDHLRSTYGPSSEVSYDETFDRIRNAPFLILDDLGAENSSSWAQEKLFQLLNHRHGHHIPTVVTTNVDLDRLDPRVRSRLLDSSLVKYCKISAPDYRTYRPNQNNQLSSLSLYSDMTFENFDVRRKLTPEERFRLESILDEAKKFAEVQQGWIVLTGPSGCGKTHLASAIANYWHSNRLEVLFVTVPDLLDYLRVTFSPNAPVTFDQRFQMIRNIPFLVLDDLSVEGSTWAKQKLFQILDYRYVTHKPTVMTITVSPKESSIKGIDNNPLSGRKTSPVVEGTSFLLENLDPRIRIRLMDTRLCTIVAITGPDYPTRMNRK